VTPVAAPFSGTGGRMVTRGPGFTLDRTRAALLCMAVALGVTAGLMGLFEPTETRYAEIAREMRASGDYLVPRLNGIAHFHKPPLAYWLTAAGFAACGVNEWGARLPVALASLLTLGFTALAARRGFAPLGVRPAPSSSRSAGRSRAIRSWPRRSRDSGRSRPRRGRRPCSARASS
jgi:hypothetical protein